MTFLRLFPDSEKLPAGVDRQKYIQGIKETVVERSNRAKRRAPRVKAPDMTVWVKELGGKEFDVRDLSVLGMGFVHGGTNFEADMRLTISIHRLGNPLLLGASIQIVRVDESVVGCEFVGLEDFHKKLLSKIVQSKQSRKNSQGGKSGAHRAVM
ncbi:MAG: PilZ domain-containing protein [Desulfovibrio sp.]|uniref:PilZ domain-containing protein n=1 Tax=Desulfovibrio sp. 7SRBS1 TaxID=3378064 RepID=UPI003B3EF3DF